MNSSNDKICIVIADDHEWVRFALKTGLESDEISCIGEAKNALEVVHLCDELHPDAVILDMFMPDKSGLESISQILEVCPETKIIHDAVRNGCSR